MPAKPIQILLIEDDDDHALIVSRQLRDSRTHRFETHRVARLADGIEALNSHRFEVALLDPGLPDCNRDEAAPRLIEADDELPVIILTTLDDQDAAVQAVKLGAQDALVKSRVTTEALTRSIRYAMERKAAQLQLRMYAEELERSNSDFQHFAHFAAHELKSPMWSISLASGVLLEKHRTQFDEESTQMLDGLVSTVKHMNTIVEDLLEFSRVESRGVPPEPADCERFLREALAELEPKVVLAKAVVTHDTLPTVCADPRQLTQVFMNLLSNALKYRREDVPTAIHVHAEKRPGQWLFSFKDNGLGVPEKQRDNIFGLFVRAHDKNKYPGTGLGLALCKRIVERHGGEIWVDSLEGEGSTFYFTLPDPKTEES